MDELRAISDIIDELIKKGYKDNQETFKKAVKTYNDLQDNFTKSIFEIIQSIENN